MSSIEAAKLLHRAAGHVGKSCGWMWRRGSSESVAYSTLLCAMYAVSGESIPPFPDSLIK